MRSRTLYQVGWIDLRHTPPRGGEMLTYSRAEAQAFRRAKRAAGCEADVVALAVFP